MLWRIKVFGLLIWTTALVSCSSTPESSGVLEPLEPAAPPAQAAEPAVSPSFQKLTERLSALGYEPIGMAYENDATLDLLVRVFSDPATSNRRIRLVYTGLQLAYDGRAESLTIGGTADVAKIVQFIKKSVPLRPASP